MSNYLMFYEHDVPSDIGDLESVAAHFGIHVTDVDIWGEARESVDPPHLGNVYLQMLFRRLEDKLKEGYPKLSINYETNGLASYFNINNHTISSLDQIIELVSVDES